MPLKVNEDYYVDQGGLLVFTEKYLLARGFCCGNGCRHCPYGKKPKGGNKAEPDSKPIKDKE